PTLPLLAGYAWVYVPCFGPTLPWAEAAWRTGHPGLVLDLMDLEGLPADFVEEAARRAALLFAGLSTHHPLLPRLRALAAAPGAALVVVTLGADGALACAPDGVVEVPAPPLPGPLVDTTGCGDAFAAGFLARWTRGGRLEEALRAGGERAARVATHRGAVPAPPV
ncbi:MAG: hypothetical protein D6731_15140, partial [Planctomycetota bacterium]